MVPRTATGRPHRKCGRPDIRHADRHKAGSTGHAPTSWVFRTLGEGRDRPRREGMPPTIPRTAVGRRHQKCGSPDIRERGGSDRSPTRRFAVSGCYRPRGAAPVARDANSGGNVTAGGVAGRKRAVTVHGGRLIYAILISVLR
jgi:hypothetical protein